MIRVFLISPHATMSGPPPAPDLADFPPLVGKEKSSITVKEGRKVSYATVTQSGSVLAEHVLSFRTEEGKEYVEVPDGVIQDTVPLWEDLVEGKFMDTAPHVAKIHAIVNKIWPLGNQLIKIEVFEVDKTTVKFRIKDANTRARILRRGMWNIANIPMVVSKWSPEEEEEEEAEITTIPMWVIMKNVPRKMFTWKGLGFIASAVGKPKRLHPDTILCKSFEEAKVFVEADVTKELPKSHHFKSKLGVAGDVQFEYPWLPPKCSLCSRWGHMGATCGGKGKNIRILKRKEVVTEETKVVDVDSTPQQHGDSSSSNEVAALAVILEEDEVSNGREEEVVGESEKEDGRDELQEVANVDACEVAKEKDGHEKLREDTVVESQLKVTGLEERSWTDVSPSKQGRIAAKKNEETGAISSPSRFAVLSEDQTESGNVIHEEDDESEEGEIVEDQTNIVSDDQKSMEQQNQGVVDGNTRRTSTRQIKGSTKPAAEKRSQSTSNLASTAGKKRTSRKL